MARRQGGGSEPNRARGGKNADAVSAINRRRTGTGVRHTAHNQWGGGLEHLRWRQRGFERLREWGVAVENIEIRCMTRFRAVDRQRRGKKVVIVDQELRR